MKNRWTFLGFLRGWGAAPRACGKGATAVEFALVAPLFLIMVLGVVEMGRVMWIKGAMQNAAEQTTRYFMVTNSACTSDLAACITSLRTYATARLAEAGMNTADFTVTPNETTISSVTYMEITVTYDFEVLVQIVKFPSVSLSARARVPYNS